MTSSNMRHLLRTLKAQRELRAERSGRSGLSVVSADLGCGDVDQVPGIQHVLAEDAQLHVVGPIGRRYERVPQPVRVLPIVGAAELAEIDVVGEKPLGARTQHAKT